MKRDSGHYDALVEAVSWRNHSQYHLRLYRSSIIPILGEVLPEVLSADLGT